MNNIPSTPTKGASCELSVVVPVYGCERCLEDLVDQVQAAIMQLGIQFEMILVDDASPDAAWQRIVELYRSRPWLRALRLSRNFGQHSAISAGIEHAVGQWTVVMDCDLQDAPDEIPSLYQKATNDHLDVVFAQRIERQDSFWKRASSIGFFATLSWLTGVQQDTSTANFGIYNRKVIDAICRMPERSRSFPLMVKWAGFATGTLPVRHQARANGKTSYTLRKLLKLAVNVILGYSEKPLRIVAASGIVCALVAFAVVITAVVRWWHGDVAVAGYTSIVGSIWLMGGLILLALGVVGMYVGQIFQNVQQRPYYIVSETINSHDSHQQ